MSLEQKKKLAQKRRWRIRKKIQGTAEKPRLNVRFSNKHMYAQCINDRQGITLCFLSSLSKKLQSKGLKANKAGAAQFGKEFSVHAIEAGISKVVFDRGGRRFHGCVQEFATSARSGGLNLGKERKESRKARKHAKK